MTHPSNPLETLSIEQIASLFAGEITHWDQLGGSMEAVKRFSRDNKSGTWDTFKSLVLEPRELTISALSERIESSAELVNAVVQTLGAIGFVGVAYVGDAKLLKASRDSGSKAFQPTAYSIGTQDYALSRKFFLYSAGEQISPLAEKLIPFVIQYEGQKQANEVGLISYYPTHYQPKSINKQTPLKYRELASLGRRLTVNFNAEINSLDLAKENRDLERLQNFAVHNPGRNFVLVDFSNSSRLEEIKDKLNNKSIAILDTLKIPYPPAASGSIEVWVI